MFKSRLVRLEATPERPQSSLSYIFYTGRSRHQISRAPLREFKDFPRKKKKKHECSRFQINWNDKTSLRDRITCFSSVEYQLWIEIGVPWWEYKYIRHMMTFFELNYFLNFHKRGSHRGCSWKLSSQTFSDCADLIHDKIGRKTQPLYYPLKLPFLIKVM